MKIMLIMIIMKMPIVVEIEQPVVEDVVSTVGIVIVTGIVAPTTVQGRVVSTTTTMMKIKKECPPTENSQEQETPTRMIPLIQVLPVPILMEVLMKHMIDILSRDRIK